MYRRRGGLILGFHGCNASIIPSILNGEPLRKSENDFDWLGHGIYFWEYSERRAQEFAIEQLARSGQATDDLDKVGILGAVIDLGNCLDLIEFENLSYLKSAYSVLSSLNQSLGKPMPENRKARGSDDLLLRNLDCAVIETLHHFRESIGQPPFDSVRGVFWEGNELYPNAGFREKDHIQICIRNPNCIKGLFLPRKEDGKFQSV